MFLIIGGDSEIGGATVRLAAERNLPVLSTTRRRERAGEPVFLDLDALDDDWRPPAEVNAACICAAVPRLAACASDPEGSAHINVHQTLRLARRLIEAHVYTLFLSTNQVFDGTRPYLSANALLCPVSAYGRQKAEAERALQGMMCEGAPVGILRLAKVVSPGMGLLATWGVELAAGRSVRAFHDMTIAPVPIAQVGDAILRMLTVRAAVVAQLTGSQDMAYADVARLIATRVGADPSLVEEASARDHGQPQGATARHTTLDSSYLREAHGIEVASAEEVILGTISEGRALGQTSK